MTSSRLYAERLLLRLPSPGTAVGLLTSGLLPGLSWCLFGVSSFQAWLTAAKLFIYPLRLIEHRRLGV